MIGRTKKVLVYVVSAIALVLIVFLFDFFYNKNFNGFKGRFETTNSIEWIFKDSIKHEIVDMVYSFQNGYNKLYRLKLGGGLLDSKGLYIDVWEGIDKNCNELELKEDKDFSHVNLDSYQILDAKSSDAVYASYGFKLYNKSELHISKYDSLIYKDVTTSYNLWYGNIRDLGIFNPKNKDYSALITNDYDSPKMLLVNFCKKNKQYLIIVKSNKEFDPSVIGVFNL